MLAEASVCDPVESVRDAETLIDFKERMCRTNV